MNWVKNNYLNCKKLLILEIEIEDKMYLKPVNHLITIKLDSMKRVKWLNHKKLRLKKFKLIEMLIQIIIEKVYNLLILCLEIKKKKFLKLNHVKMLIEFYYLIKEKVKDLLRKFLIKLKNFLNYNLINYTFYKSFFFYFEYFFLKKFRLFFRFWLI